MADVVVNIKTDISDVEKDVIKLSREVRDAKLAMQGLDKSTTDYAKKKQSVDEMSKSLTKQKDALQDLKIAAKKTADGLSETADRMGDLKDAAATTSGSGVERVKNSFGLLKEGFENLDFGKVKIGLNGLRTALAATGVMLIVQAVSYLIANFDELSKGSGALSVALKLVGDYVQWFIGTAEKLANWFTDMVGLTDEVTRGLEKQGEAIVKSAAQTKEALNSQIADMDRAMKVAKAYGRDTAGSEKEKQNAYIATNRAIIDQLAALQSAGHELTTKEKELLKESSKAISDAYAELSVIDAEAMAEKAKKDKEANEKWLESQEKKKEQEDKDREYKRTKDEEERKWNEDAEAYLAGIDQKTTNDTIKLAEQEAEAKASFFNDTVVAGQKASDELIEISKKENEAKRLIEKNSIASTQLLADTYFITKLQQAEEGSEKEREIKRKQFDVNKSFQAGQAAIDGVRATLSAYASAPPGFKIVAAISAAVFAAASVAKILATNYSGGATKPPTPTEAKTSGGGGQPASGQVPTGNQRGQDSTTYDELGNRSGGTIWVSVTDINKTQGRVAKVSEQARF